MSENNEIGNKQISLEHDGKKSWILNKLIQDGFIYKELNFDYNGVSRKGKKKSVELIIMNYNY